MYILLQRQITKCNQLNSCPFSQLYHKEIRFVYIFFIFHLSFHFFKETLRTVHQTMLGQDLIVQGLKPKYVKIAFLKRHIRVRHMNFMIFCLDQVTLRHICETSHNYNINLVLYLV